MNQSSKVRKQETQEGEAYMEELLVSTDGETRSTMHKTKHPFNPGLHFLWYEGNDVAMRRNDIQ